MKLIVGLGNPGKKYEHTRHNVGYDALDVFSKDKNITFKYEPQFEGHIGKYEKKAILLKPTTYMNLSGRSILKVMDYFKIEVNNILIIVDDVNLELGKIRLRYQGSSGGHNGLKDIISVLKTESFKRLRIGISDNDERIEYVLSKFSKKEREILYVSMNVASNIIDDFINEISFVDIMTKYNTHIKEEG
ncbi:MAG: aminoacyl-tRNA hydrolase [Acholeplasmatales bacterium]